jgi:hypothetical protein
MVEKLNQMLIGWANYFCLGAVSKAYSAVDLHARRRLRRCSATNTRKRGRAINAFRKRVVILCTVWCSYHIVLRAFRRRKRESFPRAACGKTARPVR